MSIVTPNALSSSVHVDPHPGLDKMLNNELESKAHMEPWRAENFLAFVKQEYCEENLLFYEEMDYLKAKLGNNPRYIAPQAPGLLTLPDAARVDEQVLMREIIKVFIDNNGEYSVNVSHNQRKLILDSAVVVPNPTLLASLEDAQMEVKTLLRRGPWPRFYQKMMNENLSVGITKGRYLFAGICFTLAITAWILLLALYVPRWYFFLLSLPLALGNFYAVSAWYRLCPVMSTLGKRFREAIINGKSEEVELACPFVRKANRVRARRVMLVIAALTIAQTLLAFAVTYIVDAAAALSNGPSMYQ